MHYYPTTQINQEEDPTSPLVKIDHQLGKTKFHPKAETGRHGTFPLAKVLKEEYHMQ